MTTIRTPGATRAGFVAILGAPNAGKSSLLNQMVGEKLSIVSRKAQTTRIRVLGLITQGSAQMGLIDTPGIFSAASRLDKAMVKAAWDGLEGADAILVVADAAARTAEERLAPILSALKKRGLRAFLALNKVDLIKPERLLPLARQLDETGLFEKIFMISALTGDGVADVKAALLERMPEGPWHFPEDQLTDLPERLLAAEITREQILLQLHDELPYQAAVIPQAWETRKDGSISVSQTIFVTRTTHRAIVLGKGGARIKAIGQAARAEMSAQMGCPVHLFLDVKVEADWQEKPEFYTIFGLDRRA